MEETYQNLRDRWRAGERDRALALHLLFLAWWHWAEPAFLTGLSDDPGAQALWHEIFDHCGGEASDDAEFLWVTSLMALITPWALGDEQTWNAASERLKARSLLLKPEGFSPEYFDRGTEYGEYFAHQAGPKGMPETEVRAGLAEILHLESRRDVSWTEVESLCLALRQKLIDDPRRQWPDEVLHFLDDSDIRRKDAAYARGQRSKIQRFINTGEYVPSSPVPLWTCVLTLGALLAVIVWLVA